MLPYPWHHATVTPLSGGLTNRGAQLTLHQQRYYWRQGQGKAIDRPYEYACYQLAAATGLSPPCYYAEVNNGTLILEWVAHPTWAHQPPSAHQQRDALVQVLLTLQAWPTLGPQCTLPDMFRPYRPLFKHCPPWLQAAIVQLFTQSLLPPEASVMCHGDLNPQNLLGTTPWVIDWEYACHGVASYELAMIARLHEYSANTMAQLLAAYQRGGGRGGQHWQAYLPWVDCLCALWAVQQLQGNTPHQASCLALLDKAQHYYHS